MDLDMVYFEIKNCFIWLIHHFIFPHVLVKRSSLLKNKSRFNNPRENGKNILLKHYYMDFDFKDLKVLETYIHL